MRTAFISIKTRCCKSIITFAFLLFTSAKCGGPDGFIAGVPAEAILVAPWTLEKIITPTRTLTGAQIGYKELLDITTENGYTVENTFRNDSLVEKQYWGPSFENAIDSKAKTYVIRYRYGLKRFYKLLPVKMEGEMIEASGYVTEPGAADDTVTYVYKEVFPR